MNWKEIKRIGNKVYKTGGVEPIDLFKEGEILWDWCIGEIIAKAYRNRGLEGVCEGWVPVGTNYGKIRVDLNEIIHHAQMLLAVLKEAVEVDPDDPKETRK